MNRGAKAAALMVFVAGSLRAASRPAAEQEKIDWLLSEVAHSDAVFIRNGSEYTGEKAAAHLKTKLWFAGKRVQTVEDFIAGVASHSEESGKPYEIRSKNGVVRPLQVWLRERLAVFKKGRSAIH